MAKRAEGRGNAVAGRSKTFEHLVGGTVAGAVSTITLYPLDLIKVRFQANASVGQLPWIWQAARQIFQTEGLRGLYGGIGPSLVGATVANGGFFFIYELNKDHMRKPRAGSNTEVQLSSQHHLAASMGAGAVMVLLTNPIWLIKTRLQLQQRRLGTVAAADDYRGLLHGLRCVVREEGWCALYRGIVPALLLTSNGAVQFAIYEKLKVVAPLQTAAALVGMPGTCPTFAASFANGALAKISASCLTYPYQVVKTRVQQRTSTKVPQSGREGNGGELARTLRQAAAIWRSEGIRGFFKGCWPNAVRVAPNAAITFAVYEETVKLIREAFLDGGRYALP
mmetsp:Transcript_82082/g.162985  ORF Transcript_82082/g.162985 Transcript_82082/m.162985 type:complete len:337 (+) Transcript_82082:139-1149(+)|eukprot:CAMPEP_0172671768 /NCGR_PEP_ID=MMETSP1074-20121228/11120_1 /TAXON_ID=2916 /ORGANISM="Ceratium fusus, Strain PA161109" /LENGTH=336 /DNA_ID=CAMNT_0013488869 /DNA_START=138 /DNA_END=1148 /DNA_ORIENTATION=+